MKKVLCQMCGLMNLEKFVTYPHCAGCGTRLAETAPPSRLDNWKRPLKAPLWASLVGLCCAGLGYWAVSIVRETGHAEEQPLVAYVQMPRTVTVGQPMAVQVTLDTTLPDGIAAVRSFSQVRMRLPRSNFQSFDLESVTPSGKIERQGSGRYIVFDSLQRDDTITLQLRPKKLGRAPLFFNVYVRDFTPFDFHSSLKVTRATPQKMPH